MDRIETQRLILRDFELTDQEDLCEYMLQRVNAWFEAYPNFTPDKAKEEIELRSKSDEFIAIELKEQHKVIGNVYMGQRDHDCKELGYVLNENYQGQGYGTESCQAAVQYFFKQNVPIITAETASEHTTSWRLMEKIGMKRIAHLIQNVSFHNDEAGNPIYWDTYIYQILNPQLLNYLNDEGQLKQYPMKRKARMMALAYMAFKFELDRRYTEREVNDIIKQNHTFSDHEIIRRELIIYGYMDREKDGSAYWRVVS